MASTASPWTSGTRIRHESPRHDPPAGSRAPTGVTRLVCLDRRWDASPRGHVPAPSRSRAVAPAHGRPNPTPARHRARRGADAIPIAASSLRFRPTRPLRTAAAVSTTPQSGLVAAAALRKKRSALSASWILTLDWARRPQGYGSRRRLPVSPATGVDRGRCCRPTEGGNNRAQVEVRSLDRDVQMRRLTGSCAHRTNVAFSGIRGNSMCQLGRTDQSAVVMHLHRSLRIPGRMLAEG